MDRKGAEGTDAGFAPYDARPWVSIYEDGVPADLDTPPQPDFGAVASQAAAEHGSRPAFTVCLPNGMTASLSFAELDRQADRFAAYLRHEVGLEKGDRVAIQSPNCLPYPIALFGIARAGCVIVNINPLYTAHEMGHALNDSGARALVIIDMFADKLADVIPKSSVETVIRHSVVDFFPTLRRLLVGTVQRLKGMVPRATGSFTPLRKALAQGAAHLDAGRPAAPDPLGHDDLLALQYTGGTTGAAKGAMLTHGNVLSNVRQCGYRLQKHLPDECTLMTALPLYHIFALGVSCVFVARGSHNVLIPSPRPVSNLKPAFQQFDIRFFSGVNTLFNGLLAQDWFRQDPPKNLGVTVGGGAAVVDSTAERWLEVVGSPIYQAYGLTETSPGVTTLPLNRPERRGSIGIPLVGTWCRVVDDDGNPVPVGESGELLVKGPQVMDGYWQRPDATADALRDGWLYTGDVARMDEEGYFYIVDRKKDMILVSGFNVYPNEVEAVIARHPGVQEVGVVGVPDADSGEAVRAYVVANDPELTEEAIRGHCREYLTGYKIPRQIVFRDSIPMTPVGKVLRKDLREMAKEDA